MSNLGYDCKENYFHLKQGQVTESLNFQKNKSQSGHTQGYVSFVVDMFQDVCKKLDKGSLEFLKKVIPIDERRDSLLQNDLLILLNYFKQIIIYLVKTKLELQERTVMSESSHQYEQMIQKLEADIRSHIRVEQQLRLYAEQAQSKIEDLNQEKNQYQEQLKELALQIQQKNKEITTLQVTINEIKRPSLYRNSSKSGKTITEPMTIEDQREQRDSASYHINTDHGEQKPKQPTINQMQIQAVLRKSKELIKPHYDKSPQSKYYQAFQDQKIIRNKSQLNSLIQSPEKMQRKFSQVNADTKAIKQPTIPQRQFNVKIRISSLIKLQKYQLRSNLDIQKTKILILFNIIMNQQTNNKIEILYAAFNQDASMFCIGTDSGFRVCNALNSQEKFQRDLKGGIGLVEMLYRSNILALVGGGMQPKYPETKVIIWDDHLVKCIGEMSFRSKIKNVKLKNDTVVVVLEKKIFVYNFSDLKLIEQIETCPNPRGICAINTEGEYTILATLEKSVGKVYVQHFNKKKVYCIEAHVSPISYLALNGKGSKLATASEKGTVIRIYDTATGQIQQELRRGSDYATITCLAFDFKTQWIACASDQGTIHIFSVSGTDSNNGEEQQQQQQQQQGQNPTSRFKFLGGIIPILGSEWSFAQFRVQDTRCKVEFVNDDNAIIVISYEGNYYKARFDPIKGGQCEKIEERRIINENNIN